MATMKRRRFMLLSAVTLLGAACGGGATEPAGLRDSGTVFFPRDATSQPTGAHAAEPTESALDTHMLVPTAVPVPTMVPTPPAEEDLIVPADALPTASAASTTDAEMHVMPVLSDRHGIAAALPARRVVIPTIGVDSKVIQLGTTLDRRGQIAWETAPFAVGQHKGLAGPGQNGNMVLSGHISSPNEGAVFHSLPQLKLGEGVIVSTEERQYLYRVVNVQTVTPDQVSVLDATPDATLTLITCVPDKIYSHRLVVTAHIV
jgi:LPXTG-site transpeptidase (sortase) family protein